MSPGHSVKNSVGLPRIELGPYPPHGHTLPLCYSPTEFFTPMHAHYHCAIPRTRTSYQIYLSMICPSEGVQACLIPRGSNDYTRKRFSPEGRARQDLVIDEVWVKERIRTCYETSSTHSAMKPAKQIASPSSLRTKRSGLFMKYLLWSWWSPP